MSSILLTKTILYSEKKNTQKQKLSIPQHSNTQTFSFNRYANKTHQILKWDKERLYNRTQIKQTRKNKYLVSMYN